MRTEADALLSLQRWLSGVLQAPWDIRRTMESGEQPERPFALVEYVGAVSTDGAPVAQDVTVAATLNLYIPAGGSRQAADDAALALRETVWQAVKVGVDPRSPTTDRLPLWSYDPRPEIQRVRVRDATSGTWRLVVDDGDEDDPTLIGETGAIAFDATETTVQTAVVAAFPGSLVYQRGRGIFDVHFGGPLLGQPLELATLDTTALIGPSSVTRVLVGAPAPWRSDRDWMRVTSFGQTTVRDSDDPKVVMVAVDLRCTFTRGLPIPWAQMLLQSVKVTDRLLGGC